MNKVEQLIQELCPEGMQYKKLGEIASIATGKQLNLNLLSKEGTYPVLNGGINPSGFYHEYNTEGNTITVSQGGSAGYVNFMLDSFWAGANCYVVTPISPIIDNKFLFYILKNKQDYLARSKQGAGIPHLNKSILTNYIIPIPPLPIQEEIVRILDLFTTLEMELEAELEARKKQYDFYLNKLLTPIEYNGKWLLNDKEVEWMEIKDCCLKTDNINWFDSKNTEYRYIDLTSVDIENCMITETKTVNSTNAPSRARQIVKTDDIIFGTTFPTLKRYSLITPEYDQQICSTGFCVLRANRAVIEPKYLFFLLKTESFYNHISRFQEGASYPSISDTLVKKHLIPIPSLSEQERIVSILDKFDSLVYDISIGLPAEIEARRKQYEYYRNKLLTFDEIVGD